MSLNLEEIEKACEATPDGPWECRTGNGVTGWDFIEADGDVFAEVVVFDPGKPTESHAMGHFIANARSWVPALVARVRELEAAPGKHESRPRD